MEKHATERPSQAIAAEYLALTENPAIFSTLFGDSLTGVAIAGVDGRLQCCNTAFEQYVGFQEAELQAMTFAQLSHPDEVLRDIDLFHQLTSGRRRAYRVERRCLAKGGHALWVRVSAWALKETSTTAACVIIMLTDVTADYQARVEYEGLLHNLRERVKEATALHGTAQILQNEGASVEVWLEQVAALLPPAFQWPEIAQASLRYGQLVHETDGFCDSRLRLEASFETHDGTGGAISVSYVAPVPAGVELPFLPEEQWLLDSIAEMIRTAIDRRIAEAALRRSEERLKLALVAAGMGVWELEFATGRVSWSEELVRIVGLPADGSPRTLAAFRTMVHPDDRAMLAGALRASLDDPSQNDVFAAQLRVVCPDGTLRWLASSGRILRVEGIPVRMLGIAHDVTGIRQLEQQFHHAQRLDSMGRLAGGVAHDFNNLLTVIKGYSELTLDGLAPDDQRRADLLEIGNAVNRATRLTRQLLAFSGSQVLAPRVLDPNDIVEGMQQMLRRLIGSDIEVRVALDRTAGTVRVDPGQLEQVIVNLAVNARDAMPAGGTLTFATGAAIFDEAISAQHVQLAPGAYIVLTVADTGIGMTADILAHIFEPFFTTKEKGRGTGLGLATVFGIAQQSGGAVWAYSEPGAGSTFKVYLPRVNAMAEPEPAAAAPPTSLRGDELVLLLDDDADIRILAERALVSHGYRVAAFANGPDALDYLADARAPIDLLVTDVVMPRMRGAEVAAMVRAAHPTVRVLYVTGYTDRVIEPGATPDVLEKPFTPRALLCAVRDTLDRRPASSAQQSIS